MRRFRTIAPIALVLAAVAVALPLQALAQSVPARAHSRAATVSTYVRTPGVYEIGLVVASRSRRRAVVEVQIGRVMRRSLRLRGRRGMHLHARLRIRGHRLTIRATGRVRLARLFVTSLRRVKSKRLRPGRHHKRSGSRSADTETSHTAPPAAAAALAGPTGPTGTTGATGAPTGSSAAAGAPVSSGSTGAAGATGAAGPPGDSSDWQMVFDDEFDGTALDTTKWSTGWMGSGITAPVNSEELECYDPAQVSEGGGELDLTLTAKEETCGGMTRPYASGMVTTDGKFSYTYGYLEARVWVPGNGVISDWPAVWTDGQSWPQDGELDVVEGLGGQACWHFHDPSGAPGGCSSTTFTGGWHTFGADWEPGSVTYYYDGNVVGSVTSGVTDSPMFVILDLAVDGTYGGPIQAPDTLRVDYVRIWQHA